MEQETAFNNSIDNCGVVGFGCVTEQLRCYMSMVIWMPLFYLLDAYIQENRYGAKSKKAFRFWTGTETEQLFPRGLDSWN